MDTVARSLRDIENAIASTGKTATAATITRGFERISNGATRSTRKIGKETDKFAAEIKRVNRQLQPLKATMGALDAEFRNIEWGEVLDTDQFKKAQGSAKRYATEIGKLSQQIKGQSAAERKLAAQLKRKEKTIRAQIELQRQERAAARFAMRIGESQAIRMVGVNTIRPFVRAGSEGVQVLAEFDDKMSQVAAVSGATTKQLESLRKEAQKLGGSTRFTAGQVAEAENFLALSGMKTRDILASVSDTLDLAAAGKLELGTATDIATDTMSAFQIEAKDLSRVTNVMAKTAATSNTDILQLGEAFQYSATNAQQFGISIEETAALLGTAANIGVKGSMAGTSLRAGLINLSKEKKQQDLLRDFGVSVTDERGVARNIIDIIGDLKQSLDVNFRDPQFVSDLEKVQADIAAGTVGAEDQLKILQEKYPQYASGLSKLAGVFGKTAVTFWSGQIGQYEKLKRQALVEFASGVDENLLAEALGFKPSQDLYAEVLAQTDSYEEAVKVLTGGIEGLIKSGKGGEGAARAMARIMEDNLAGSFRSLGSAIEAVKIAYIEPLKPMIMGIVNGLAGLLRFLANLPTPIRFMISSMAVLTVTAAGLAAVIGTLGAVLFGFSQAASIAAIASSNLARGAAIPLTGFFQTSMETGFMSTSPLRTLYETAGAFFNDLGTGFEGTLGKAKQGLIIWARSVKLILQEVAIASKALLLNPFTVYVGGFLVLNAILEQVVPGFNLLGTILSAIAAPAGFLWGILKGLTESLLDFLHLGGSGAIGAIAPLFTTISRAIAQAAETFGLFSAKGEEVGRWLGDLLTAPFRWAGKVIVEAWNYTIEAIRKPLTPFADFVARISRLIVHLLAENSPGLTMSIREAWQYTIGFIVQKLGTLVAVATKVFSVISGSFQNWINFIAQNSIFAFISGAALQFSMDVARVFAVATLGFNPLIDGLLLILSLFGRVTKIVGLWAALGKGFEALRNSFDGLIGSWLDFIDRYSLLVNIASGFLFMGTVVAHLFAVALIGINPVLDGLVIALQLVTGLGIGLSLVANIVSGAAVSGDLFQFLRDDTLGAGYEDVARRVATAWGITLGYISGRIQSFVAWLQTIKTAILHALAENSPGLTSMIREKWDYTFDWLQVRIGGFINWLKSAYSAIAKTIHLVHDALFGMPESVKQQAREDLFVGILRGIEAVGHGLTGMIEKLQQTPSRIDRLVQNALDNLDFFSFAALLGSSLPVTLMEQLAPGAALVVRELGMIVTTGIPRAILYALPGAVAYAISSGMILGAETAISNFLDRLPDMLHNLVAGFRDFLSPELKELTNETISGVFSEIIQAFGGNALSFDVEEFLAGIDNFIDTGLIALIDYLHQVGDVSRQVGRQIAQMLIPLVSFKILPFLPSSLVTFTTIVPLIKSFQELLGSPALQGILGFLQSNLLPAIGETFLTAGAAVGYFLTILTSAPSILLAETLEHFFGVLSRAGEAVAEVRRMFSLTQLFQDALRFGSDIINILLPKFLRSIPYIGGWLEAAFVNMVAILSRFFPRFARILIETFPAERLSRLFTSYGGVFAAIGRGIAYAFTEGIAPVADILVKLLNPLSLISFLKLYFRTGGFRTIVKKGLFAVNPIDFLFGNKWMSGILGAFKVFAGMAFPVNIVSSKMSEAMQMLANPMARAEALRRGKSSGIGLMVSRLQIYQEALGPVKVLIRLLEGLMILNPLIQAIGSLTMAFTFWYTILKPVNKEMLDAIANVRVLGISMQPLALALQVFRFLAVDVGEVLGGAMIQLPGQILTAMRFFDRLGDTLGDLTYGAIELSRILFNLTKTLVFNPLFAALTIPLLQGIKVITIAFRGLLQLLRDKTEQYGDAIGALWHFNLVALPARLIEDLLWLIGNGVKLTIMAALAGIKLLGKALVSLGKTSLYFLLHPWALITKPLGYAIAMMGQLTNWAAKFGDRMTFVNAVLISIIVAITRIGRGVAAFNWISLAILAVGFLIEEYINGFSNLDAIIKSLAHPIAWLNSLLQGIGELLDFKVPEGFSDFVANLVNAFVSMLPAIVGGMLLIGLTMRKSIGGAFGFIIDSGLNFVRIIRDTIDRMQNLGFIAGRFLNQHTPLPLMGARAVHGVRSRSSFLGLANPIAYSQDPRQQERANQVGAHLAMAKEMQRYQTQLRRQMQREQQRYAKEQARIIRFGSEQERAHLLATTGYDEETGRSYRVMPKMERSRDRWGRESYQLTRRGREEQKKEFLERVNVSGLGARIAQNSGLAEAYMKATGRQLTPEQLANYSRTALSERGISGNAIVNEVRQGLEALNGPLNAEQIKSKFLYVDVLKIAGGTNPNKLDNRQYRALVDNPQMPQELRNAAAGLQNLEGMQRTYENLFRDNVKRDRAESQHANQIDQVNNSLRNFFRSLGMEAEAEKYLINKDRFSQGGRILSANQPTPSGTRGDRHGNVRAESSSPPTATQRAANQAEFNRFIGEMIDHVRQQQVNAIIAAAESHGLDRSQILTPQVLGMRSDIVTGPVDVLRQGVDNLVRQSVTAVDELEATAQQGAQRARRGFWAMTGIPELINNLKQNFQLATLARNLQGRAAMTEFTHDRRNAIARERRERNLQAILSRRGVGHSSELLGDSQLQGIFNHFMQEGTARQRLQADHFKHYRAYLGGSFDNANTKDFQNLFRENLKQSDLEKLRKFFSHGIGGDSGIAKEELQRIATELRNKGVEMRGRDTSALESLRQQLKGTMVNGRDQTGEFAAMLGSPSDTIKATQEQIDKITASLGIRNINQLKGYISSGDWLRGITNRVKDYFRTLELRVEELNFRIKERIKDLRVFAETIGAEKLFDGVVNFGKPLYRKIRNGIISSIKGIYTNAEAAADGLRNRFFSLSTVGAIREIRQTVIQGSRGLLQIGREFGGRNFNSVTQFSDNLTQELLKSQITKETDRLKIAAAFLQNRAPGQSIASLLESMNYKGSMKSITEALAKTLKINVEQAAQLLQDPSMTARMGMPVQFVILRQLPRLGMAIAKDLQVVFAKGWSLLSKVAIPVARFGFQALAPEVADRVSRLTYRFGLTVAQGLDKTSNAMATVLGNNPLSNWLRRWADTWREGTLRFTTNMQSVIDFGDNRGFIDTIRDKAQQIYRKIAQNLDETATRLNLAGAWQKIKTAFGKIKLGLINMFSPDAPRSDRSGGLGKIAEYLRRPVGIRTSGGMMDAINNRGRQVEVPGNMGDRNFLRDRDFELPQFRFVEDRVSNLRNRLANWLDEVTNKERNLAGENNNVTNQITQNWQAAKARIVGAWNDAAGKIGGAMRSLLGWGTSVGQGLIMRLNHSPTIRIPAAWQGATERIQGNMQQLTESAAQAGQRMQNSLMGAAERSASGLWKTGVALGTAFGAVGMSAQTIGFSLQSLGILEADSELAHMLDTLGQISMMTGAISGILMPLIGVVTEAVPAVTAGLTLISGLVSGIGGAIAGWAGLSTAGFLPLILGAGAIALAAVGIYEAFKHNFLGITSLAKSLGNTLKTVLSAPAAWIAEVWQHAIGSIGEMMGGWLSNASDTARGLINRLNHNPTEVIPDSWSGATDRIKGDLDTLVEHGRAAGAALAEKMKPNSEEENSSFDPMGSIKGLFSGTKNFFGKMFSQSPETNIANLFYDALLIQNEYLKALTIYSQGTFDFLKKNGLPNHPLAIGVESVSYKSIFSNLLKALLVFVGKAVMAIVETINIVISLLGLLVAIFRTLASGEKMAELGKGIATVFAKMDFLHVFRAIDAIFLLITNFFRGLANPIKTLAAWNDTAFASTGASLMSMFEELGKIVLAFGRGLEVFLVKLDFLYVFRAVYTVVKAIGNLGYFLGEVIDLFVLLVSTVNWVIRLVDILIYGLVELGRLLGKVLGSDFLVEVFVDLFEILHNVLKWFADLDYGAIGTSIVQGFVATWDALGNFFSWAGSSIKFAYEQIKGLGEFLYKGGKIFFTTLWRGMLVTYYEFKAVLVAIFDAFSFLGHAIIDTVSIIGSAVGGLFGLGSFLGMTGQNSQVASASGVPGASPDALDSSDRVRSNWSKTVDSIKRDTSTLIPTTKKTGHMLKANLSEASPGPTFWIRKNWQKTIDNISQGVNSFAKRVVYMGVDIRRGFSIAPVVNRDLSRIRYSLNNLAYGFVSFGERASVALLTLNFPKLQREIAFFGQTASKTLGGMVAGFKALTLNTLAYGIASVLAFSPALAALAVFLVSTAALAFTAAVIVSNFLGLRSIIKGTFQIGIGLGQILYGILQGISLVVVGVFRTIFGLFRLLQGDVLGFWDSLDLVRQGFGVMGDAIAQGLKTIAKGFGNIFDGIAIALEQVFGLPVSKAKEQMAELWAIFKHGAFAGDWVAEQLIRAVRRVWGLLKWGIGALRNDLTNFTEFVTTKIREIPQKLASIPSSLGYLFSKQGLAAAGFSNPFAHLAQSFKGTVGLLPKLITAPLIYIYDFVYAFSRRLWLEIPQSLRDRFWEGVTRVRTAWVNFLNWLGNHPVVIAGIAKFETTVMDMARAWDRFAAWFPKNGQELSRVFADLTNKLEYYWHKFTQGLRSSQLIPNSLRGLSELITKAISLLGRLSDRFYEWQQKLHPGVLDDFFAGLREWQVKAVAWIERMDEKWQQLREQFKFLPSFANLTTTLWAWANDFAQVINKAEVLWLKFGQWLSKTNIFDNTIWFIEDLLKHFRTGVDFLRAYWGPFVKWLAKTDSFDTIFDTLRSWGARIPQYWEELKLWWYDFKAMLGRQIEAAWGYWQQFTDWLKSDLSWGEKVTQVWELIKVHANKAIDAVKAAWRGFVGIFEEILWPTVQVAVKIAQSIISALNCHASERVTGAWQEATEKIVTVIKGILAPIKRVAEAIIAAFKPVTNFLSDFGRGLFIGLQERLPKIEFPGISRTITAVRELFGEVGRLFNIIQQTYAQASGGGLTRSMEGIDFTSGAARKTVVALIDVIELLSRGVNIAGEGLGLFVSALNKVIRAISRLINFTRGLIEGFLEPVRPALAELLPYWEKIVTGLKDGAHWLGQVSAIGDRVRAALNNIFPSFAPASEGIKDFVQQLQAAEDVGRAVGQAIGGAIASVVTGIKESIQWIDNLVTSAKNVIGHWLDVGKGIRGVFSRLKGESAEAGYELQRNISQGSPGPTYYIQQHWAATGEHVSNVMDSMVDQARTAGSDIESALNVQTSVTQAIERIDEPMDGITTAIAEYVPGTTPALTDITEATDEPGPMRDITAQAEAIDELADSQTRLGEAGQTSRQALMSVGAALSNFAPQVATPLFVANDLIDAYSDLSDAVPALANTFRAADAARIASNSAITASNASVATSATGAGAATVAGSTAASTATVASGSIIGGIQAMLAAGWSMVAGAAMAAGSAIWGFLLGPIAPIVVGLALAITALYLAIKSNFVGIHDITRNLRTVFVSLFAPIIIGVKLIYTFAKALIEGVFIQGKAIFDIFHDTIKSALVSITGAFAALFTPFSEFLQLFFGRGGATDIYSVVRSIGQGIVNFIFMPLKIVLTVVSTAITWVFSLLKPIAIFIGELILIASGFSTIVTLIYLIGKAVWSILSSVFGVIFQELAVIWSTIKESFSFAIEPITDLMNLFGGSGGGNNPLVLGLKLAAFFISLLAKAITRSLIVPIKILSFLIQILVKGLGLIGRVAVLGLSPVIAIVKLIVYAFKGVSFVIGKVIGAFKFFAKAIVNLVMAPLRPFFWLLETAKKLTGLGGGGAARNSEPVKRASGGLVTGPGTSTSDSIPALLSNREFVVRASSVRGNLGLLQHLNEHGTLPNSELKVEPTPLPRIPQYQGTPATSTALAPAPAASEPKIEVNLNISGDIVLGGSNSAEQAMEFLDYLRPYLGTEIARILRDRVENQR